MINKRHLMVILFLLSLASIQLFGIHTLNNFKRIKITEIVPTSAVLRAESDKRMFSSCKVNYILFEWTFSELILKSNYNFFFGTTLTILGSCIWIMSIFIKINEI